VQLSSTSEFANAIVAFGALLERSSTVGSRTRIACTRSGTYKEVRCVAGLRYLENKAQEKAILVLLLCGDVVQRLGLSAVSVGS